MKTQQSADVFLVIYFCFKLSKQNKFCFCRYINHWTPSFSLVDSCNQFICTFSLSFWLFINYLESR